jgi:hypothetical protein
LALHLQQKGLVFFQSSLSEFPCLCTLLIRTVVFADKLDAAAILDSN